MSETRSPAPEPTSTPSPQPSPKPSPAPPSDPRPSGLLRLLPRLLFAFYILYCVEAGVFLAWVPWTGFWERTFMALSWPTLGQWMLDPWMRGAVTGFGVVHLVWGIHDLERWLTRGARRVLSSS